MGSRCRGLCWPGNKGNAEQCNVTFQKKQTGKLYEQRNPVVVCFSSHHVPSSCPWNGSMASAPQRLAQYAALLQEMLGQSYFMIGDKHMYDSSTDSRFQCRSLNINEDLGTY
ncbi:Phospholipid-transporting ATPase 1 [Camellia lanceoleosa]|uniref:Phospholipid-transporting ATPase 1 n=1 Tax=Camellia lanceoleosa TaxID=1840588 RepID=A0ACC0HUE3_9ERIC|nr:Phospholipid-transporting ATPase 1 [Camellia lanceoleosa]